MGRHLAGAGRHEFEWQDFRFPFAIAIYRVLELKPKSLLQQGKYSPAAATKESACAGRTRPERTNNSHLTSDLTFAHGLMQLSQLATLELLVSELHQDWRRRI